MLIDNTELLLQDISRLYNNTNNCDVKIIVGNGDYIETFKAHSIILRIRSNYFNVALSNKLTKNVNIPNINPNAFKIILKYCYTGYYSIDEENNQKYIIELLIAAHELEFTELVKHIQDNIVINKEDWIRQNFLEIYNAAFKYENFNIIREYCEGLICKCPELIFESHNFNSMEKSLLISLIKKDDLALGEIEIWNYIIKWGMEQEPKINLKISELTQNDYAELKDRLRKVLQHIRFFAIPCDDFWETIWPLRKLFSDALIDSLVNYNLSSNITIPPPVHSLSTRIPKKLNCSNIISLRQANIIANWIDKIDDKIDDKIENNSYNYELLLRGNRDGMNIDDFDSICELNSTLVVIKIQGSEIIVGGYNPINWYDDECDWLSTSESFIFSFDNIKKDSYVLSRVKDPESAIKNFGDNVGFGDLQFFPFGYYNHYSYEKKIINANLFNIEEYEIFRVTIFD